MPIAGNKMYQRLIEQYNRLIQYTKKQFCEKEWPTHKNDNITILRKQDQSY